MSWASIKKAINSSLGRSDFKPLNELFFEGKSLEASDELYLTIFSGRQVLTTSNAEYMIPKKITMKNSGSCYVSAIIGSNSSSEDYSTSYIEIYINGQSVKTINFAGNDNNESSRERITYNQNDVITFKAVASGFGSSGKSEHRLLDVSLYASLLDTSPLRVEGI